MVSVVELSDWCANYLVPIPTAARGVCSTCRRGVGESYERCYRCQGASRQLGAAAADVVVPVSLAVKGRQLAYELWRYKAPTISPNVRIQLTQRLAAVLWRFLGHHEPCVARAAGVGNFDIVTAVPTSRARDDHPLPRMLAGMIGATRERYMEVLSADSLVVRDRVLRSDRYRASADAGGRSVLLVDDTWTTGAHAQGAAHALKRAGATTVAIVVIGRHVDPAFESTISCLAKGRSNPFSWDTCCVHLAD